MAKCSETLVQDPLYKNLSPCASPDSQKHGLPRPSNFGVACPDRFVILFTFGWFRCCLVAAVLVVSAGDNLRLLSARLLAPTPCKLNFLVMVGGLSIRTKVSSM